MKIIRLRPWTKGEVNRFEIASNEFVSLLAYDFFPDYKEMEPDFLRKKPEALIVNYLEVGENSRPYEFCGNIGKLEDPFDDFVGMPKQVNLNGELFEKRCQREMRFLQYDDNTKPFFEVIYLPESRMHNLLRKTYDYLIRRK